MNYVKIEKIDRIKVNRKTFNKKRIRKLIPFFLVEASGYAPESKTFLKDFSTSLVYA